MKATTTMNYGLWLLANDDGTITLTGWTETTPAATPDSPPRTEHWPTYTLCQHRQQLPSRLEQLGLHLAAGAHLNDFDNHWDVYVEHPDLNALRAQLNNEGAPRSD
jgi:hypothetical protein